MKEQLQALPLEFKKILEQNILAYWLKYAPDEVHGGFFGHVDYYDRPQLGAPKGCVLNARILWTFAAAYRALRKPEYLAAAQRAFDYLCTRFEDQHHGGMYWSVDALGEKLNSRKQTYAQAFALYAFCEYYAATFQPVALEKAQQLFLLMEKHCAEREHGGYVEALSEQWEPIADVRLSEKDANEKKSMNTHLHVLEAYTNLSRVWPEPAVREALRGLIQIFLERIIDPRHGHFNLFFDEAWQVRSPIVSFGHDLEGAWLLHEAAQVCGDAKLRQEMKLHSLSLIEAALEGHDEDGGLMNEENIVAGGLDSDKHWWQQAEALVGLLHAYELTRSGEYLEHFFAVWDFIKRKIIDHERGEWYWKVNRAGAPFPEDEKIGFWKCPYHNSRACLEVTARIKRLAP
ncbi:MAG: AGE family epimerase/isomerase [candidate division KSB1 bacterium]